MDQSKPINIHLLPRESEETDIRDVIFQSVLHKEIIASLKVMENGMIAGIEEMKKVAQSIGLEIISLIPAGSQVRKGSIIAVVKGNPKQIAKAEDLLVGLIAKSSGIATAARKAVELANGRVTIVSGAWKKMPFQIKEMIREALMLGGVEVRMSREPFIYLDKNYIRIFGSIEEALENVKGLEDRVKVVQIKGDTDSIEREAVKAANCGADIIVVDTGNVADLEQVAKVLRKNNLRGKVKLAFGGSIKLEDIPKLCEKDVDILDVGRAIVDAPMLDVKLDVNFRGRKMELNLLGKTEIWIENIKLKDADLNEIARVTAEVLGLKRGEVIVTDVRENHIVLDILRKTVYAEHIFGKKDRLLKRLSELPGVIITKETMIHSEGILGFIALDEEAAKEVTKRSQQMVEEIKSKVARRAMVFSTGFEVKRGIIKDTNTPMIAERLKKERYQVTRGDTLEDDETHISLGILDAARRGYGLVIITGGIGAEDKDRTVEGILKVDPYAATPYIVKFEKGTGRHVKDGVKIAVGKVGETTIVALPGPTDEVKPSLEAAIQGISEGLDKNALANFVAEVLRKRLRNKMAKPLAHRKVNV